MAIPLHKDSLSLDGFVRQTGAKPDLVKIDVEGSERRDPAGKQTFLTDIRPAVVVELHAFRGKQVVQTADAILQILRHCRYGMIRRGRKGQRIMSVSFGAYKNPMCRVPRSPIASS